MTADTRAERDPRPAHRTQRLFIAMGVLAAAAVVLLVTWVLAPRQVAKAPREKVVEAPPQATPVQLFFASPEGTTLVGESRVVSMPDNVAERLRTLVHELAAGSTAGAQPLVPSATTLRAAYVLQNGETLCLDFSRDLRTGLNPGSTAEYLALQSLLETVGANVPGVRRVQVLIEGEIVESLGGHYDLTRPLELEEWKEAAP
jgi:germination protein M